MTRAAGLLALAVLLIGVEGCFSRFIMRGDTTRSADGWTIVLEALKDGPNSVQTSGDTYTAPARGSRFLWAWMKFRNDVAARRTFGYDACDLDFGDTAILPAVIGMRIFYKREEDRSDVYEPGETMGRHLIFAYPVHQMPTRLRCGNMVFAIPRPATAARP